MKREIMLNGPITSKMLVFADLATEYQSGVYHFEPNDPLAYENELIGSHAVLIVGWGEIKRIMTPTPSLEGDTELVSTVKYWVVKNSWGPDWGDAGYFKIRMGDCYLAQASYEGAYACTPEEESGLAIF